MASALSAPRSPWLPACASICSAVASSALTAGTSPHSTTPSRSQGSSSAATSARPRTGTDRSRALNLIPLKLQPSLLGSTLVHEHQALRRSQGSALSTGVRGLRRTVGATRAGAGAGAMPMDVAKRVSASMPCPEGYRPNVGICLVNRENKVFVANRIDKPGSWQMPQGGIDPGEDPATAARRELREETGVTSADLLAEVPEWLCYDFPPDVRVKLAVAWGKDWQGQAQKWFLFRFTGQDDSEITLLEDERPEFDEWKWLEVPGVIDAAVEFKRPVYEAAFKVFEPFLKQ